MKITLPVHSTMKLSATQIGMIYLHIFLLYFFLPHTAFSAWTPITGIPEPSFGVNQVAASTPSPWTSGVAGFYYVCPTCSGNTDTTNTYGYPTKPRTTIPNPIPAGSVVEVHGSFDGDSLTVNSSGTSTSPVFLRGIVGSIPRISCDTNLIGSYLIIENILFAPTNSSDSSFRVDIPEGSHHIAVRNCELSGNLLRAGGIGAGSWGYTGTEYAHDILLNNLYIHDTGDVKSDIDQDSHSASINGSVYNYWLVNSEMARSSGDGIQIEAQQGRRDKIHHIYVGKNKSHDHKQTGMWIKHATDVIFSENIIYGHTSSNSSAGQATGFQYGPQYVWFINNTIYNNSIGIAFFSDDPPGDGTEAYAIGNLIYNTHNSSDPINPYGSGCMSIRGSLNRYIINNTCYDSDSGINGLASSGKYILINNILANRTQSTTYDIDLENGGTTNSIVSNTIFNSTGGLRINWNGGTYTSLATFQSGTGKGSGCKVGDPLFVNAGTNNYTLQASSPGVDAGILSDVYATFQSRYGINIAKDLSGKVRPYGAKWDIGAYEFTGTSALPTLPAPTIIKISPM